MTGESPGAFVMPWGEHKGKALKEIGSADRGLDYLDWLIGWLEDKDREESDVYRNVVAYLGR